MKAIVPFVNHMQTSSIQIEHIPGEHEQMARAAGEISDKATARDTGLINMPRH